MPLRSPLLSGNTKLQNCLASHAAHVGPGARGRHVALIQSALVRLRVLDAADARRDVKTLQHTAVPLRELIQGTIHAAYTVLGQALRLFQPLTFQDVVDERIVPAV